MAKRGPREAVIGDNKMSDDERYSLTEKHRKKYEDLLFVKNTALENLAEHRKIIREDLGAKGLADIKDLIALSTPEGEEAMKLEMERKARVLRWMQVPIGTNGELFGEPDSRPITERAYNEGRRAGLAGEPHKNPHHQTNAAHDSYNDGFVQGQEALASRGFKPLPKGECNAIDNLIQN